MAVNEGGTTFADNFTEISIISNRGLNGGNRQLLQRQERSDCQYSFRDSDFRNRGRGGFSSLDHASRVS